MWTIAKERQEASNQVIPPTAKSSGQTKFLSKHCDISEHTEQAVLVHLVTYICMFVPAIDKKEELHLKEGKHVCMGGHRGRKGKSEMM